jgi:hypothetical protein
MAYILITSFNNEGPNTSSVILYTQPSQRRSWAFVNEVVYSKSNKIKNALPTLTKILGLNCTIRIESNEHHNCCTSNY